MMDSRGAILVPPSAVTRLPAARLTGHCSLEEALQKRRSARAFGARPLALAELAQLLWAAQGATGGGLRTAPSAGALYPLVLYVAVGNVDQLAPGIYRYFPESHALRLGSEGECLCGAGEAAGNQDFVGRAAAVLIIAADQARTAGKYGERAIRYVYMEIGHAARNVLLQATALGLNAVPVGAFDDQLLQEHVHPDGAERVRYMVAVGRG
jgi:SagB-type dehydrogenase family enzyme